MRFPLHLLRASTFRSEPAMAAMAAIAIGMSVGTWIIGPAITRDSAEATTPPVQERTTFEDMVARPDPSPYRASTPAFDQSGPPHYATAARQKARAELRGHVSDSEEPAPERPRASQAWSGNYRTFDRHRVY